MEELLEFWFGSSFEDGFPCQPDRVDLWFRATPAHDWEIYRRFHRLTEQALHGELENWAETPHGRLALILLLDQLPRHLFRHSCWAYRGDGAALRHCREALELGQDRPLLACQRLFLYAPLEHCEELSTQQQALANFDRFVAEAPPATARRLAFFAHWIRVHHDVIERFGRFPWRNRVLGRANTPDETAYLVNNPPYLGQW
ncbi:MAG: DUF924 domain-containing protein [Candidatus Eremiobacteraeota bacterium]|nr:DUF924 domain-containing protein [Candidatus Eremiobacteraeota bacterium]MCW5868843.1 DUF924 domain-containing protein [Candidatus Eremiobacteraeota bacterium]